MYITQQYYNIYLKEPNNIYDMNKSVTEKCHLLYFITF